MSAWVVSKAHIDALLTAGLRRDWAGSLSWYHEDERHELTPATADQVGAMLWAENVASVGYRYSPEGRRWYYGDEYAESTEPTPTAELPGTYQQEVISPELEPIRTAEWMSPYSYPAPRTLGGGCVVIVDENTPAERTPVEILKAISCYEYQSCEHEDWKGSEARAFCEALRAKMIHSLPGYSEAAWGID